MFVYGTLRRGEGNHHLLATARFVRDARTAPLYTLFALDGYPGWYDRTDVVLADGERVLAYLLPSQFTAGRREIPSGDWVLWVRDP